MAEIDFSIASKIAPPQFDPFGTAGKAMALQQGGLAVQQGLLNNRLLQQEVAGKIARGQAAQGAIDQTTGRFDPDAFMRNLASTPEGAQFASEAATLAQQQRLAQIQATTAQLTQRREELGLNESQGKFLSNGMMPFIERFTRPDPATGRAATPTKADFTAAMSDVIAAMGGDVDDNVVKRAASLLVSMKDDPAEIMRQAKYLAIMGNPTEAVAQLFGAPTTIDRGPEVLIKQVSPLTGETSISGVVPKGRSPSETEALVEVYDPATRSMVKRRSGDVSGDAPRAGAPTVAAAPALGEAEAVTDLTKRGVETFANWTRQAEIAPQQKADLQTIRGLAQQFTTGTFADKIGFLNRLAATVGVPVPQAADAAAAQEEANKLMQQFVNRSIENLGGSGTDAKLASGLKGNPNEFMTREGLMGATALMLGQIDAEVARNAAAQKWMAAGGKPDDYQAFVAQFQKLYNPRVFQSVHMSDAQRKKMLGAMSEPERKQFQKDWVFAKKAGWIE